MTWTRLQPCDGPACPRCGCQDTDVDRRRQRWGTASVRYRCNHCGQTWHPTRWQGSPVPAQPTATPEPEPNGNGDVSLGGAVVYRPIRCPDCGSTETKVTSTRRPTRYHKCLGCGGTFKSVERTDGQ